MVTERTVGMAIGMPPISNTRRLSMPGRYARCWIGYITMISTIIPTAIEQIQKFPIAVNTYIDTYTMIAIGGGVITIVYQIKDSLHPITFWKWPT